MKYDINNELKEKSDSGEIFLEDSVLWYILPFEEVYYLGLSIHQKINHKQSLFIKQ
ncbi:hypothetical protein [Tenacibaculum halocynthiae]|uniref:hypothetical protein n=1 Tax=Tenacibaculum halocynthiae TaxID=1254437 RepID=UPI0038B4A6B8